MTKALVLGGNGYLGNELVRQLATYGQPIVSVDLEIPVVQLSNVEYVSVDISDEKQLATLFNHCHFDTVFHFAGISSLTDASEDFVKTLWINSLMTLDILKHMHNRGIGRLVYASSMYVFSETGGAYRLSKQLSEQIIEEFCKNYSVESSIIRFGSIYGPGSNDSNGLHGIIKHALTNESIKYEGDPDSMREYIHIRDAVRACIEIAHLDTVQSNIYLVTGDRLMRVYDVLLMIKEMLGNKKLIEFENRNDSGHYVTTPFAYKPSTAVKYQLGNVSDFSQGLWELIHYVADSENPKLLNGDL
jgi:UDP-glucose 4-epimerase